MRTAVFILSADHSGSTWVGYILGSHSQSAFLGEFYRGWNPKIRQPCAICYDLGLPQCEVFHGVEDVPRNRALEWAFERTHRRLLVDTSKVTSWLDEATGSTKGIDVRIIHLLRDPRGWFASHLRRQPNLSWLPAMNDWLGQNQAISNFLRSASHPYMNVFYDDVASNPQRICHALFAFCGFRFESEALNYWTRDHHGFASNGATSMVLPNDPAEVKNDHFRTGDDAFYRLKRRTQFSDDRWKQELTRETREAIEAYAPVNMYLLAHEKKMMDGGLASTQSQLQRRL
jgi:hypothetical protein